MARARLQAEVSHRLASAGTDYRAVLDEVVRLVADTTGDMWFLRLDDADRTRIDIHARDPKLLAIAREIEAAFRAGALPSLTDRARRERRTLRFAPDAYDQALAAMDPQVAALVSRLAPAAFVAVPLHGRSGDFGALGIVRQGPELSDETVEVVEDFAARISLTVDVLRLLEQASAEVAERRRAEGALSAQQGLLTRVARGQPLEETLTALCAQVEHTVPGSLCSIQVLDTERRVLRQAAAPSLPTDFARAVDHIPAADGVGACGSAVHGRADVVIEDVLGDRRTAPFESLARLHGIRSVWSHPLIGEEGEVLGTFSIYRREVHSPGVAEVQTVSRAGSIAEVAIERARAEHALSDATQRDPLTGLPNRSLFLDLLGTALRRADGSRQVAVLFLDLDRFKLVNDSLGHAAGDRLLVEAAGRMSAQLVARTTLARFGGDEFTVLCEDVASAAVERLASSLGGVLLEPFEIDGGEFFLSVSIGIAFADVTSDPSSLVRDADAAMYEAKDRGRSRYEVFDARMREHTIARLSLENELRRALEGGQIAVHYQPMVDLRTGRALGAEALVRWDHPTVGALGPDAFVPVAEESGLIIPLGDMVLQSAVRDAAGWVEAGLDVRVAVNVSTYQLADPELVERIERTLDRFGLEPGRLTVEVTETRVIEDMRLARSVVDAIAGLGVRLVIDDFGTGYSSIARLRGLPFSGVKIDQSFIVQLGTDSAARPVVGAIVELAHALDLTTVAEGVEDEGALQALVELDCDVAQGFHLCPPVTADEARAALARRWSTRALDVPGA